MRLLILFLFSGMAFADVSGVGNGSFTWTAQPNYGPERVGHILVGGQIFTVTQASGCVWSISPMTVSFGVGASSGSVTVSASNPACSWSASSNASWIQINSGFFGLGNGNVNYSVTKNSGGPKSVRTGTMTIAGQAFTVSQK